MSFLTGSGLDQAAESGSRGGKRMRSCDFQTRVVTWGVCHEQCPVLQAGGLSVSPSKEALFCK